MSPEACRPVLKGRVPLHHQWEAFDFATVHPKVVVSLPPGAGKTTVAQLALARAFLEKPTGHALVLGPSAQLMRQTHGDTGGVLPGLKLGTFDSPGIGKAPRPGVCPVQVVFGTYRKLAGTGARGEARNAAGIPVWAATVPWDLIILDEASRIPPASLAAVRALARKAPRVLALDATPFGNDAGSLWKTVHAAGVQPWPSEYEFESRYCWRPEQANAWQSAMRLTAMGRRQVRSLVEPHVHGRTWPELMADAAARGDQESLRRFRFPERLPEVTLWAPLHPDQVEVLAAADADARRRRMRETPRATVESILDGCKLPEGSLGRYTRVDRAIQWMGDRRTEFGKAVVFSEHVDQAHAFAERWEARGFGRCLVVTGTAKKQERLDAVDAFTNDPEVTALAGSSVLETGLNLQASNLQVNLGISWNPAREAQREGRVARMGSRHATYQVLHVLLEHDIERAKLRTHERKIGEALSVLPWRVGA
ncbi:superfamily II DNA or RNA helicase [Motilibacter rhizosphaerae]|uniref:Superfamily II DNA or RNA helicase n=1 Tax=Motilibacter rhizosphaerae TaxID=598652 RepID=A0A4Q7NTZ2_9ACTN|nr:helicase-related protein [Motilibacter rhizosphaerae]RZS89882.1 superfamily II DNA or RNA helicase [Motilibacter rhizosphaerae]